MTLMNTVERGTISRMNYGFDACSPRRCSFSQNDSVDQPFEYTACIAKVATVVTCSLVSSRVRNVVNLDPTGSSRCYDAVSVQSCRMIITSAGDC